MTKKWEELRTTPEDIVDRIGNIANRSDINEMKELMIKEIYAYTEAQVHSRMKETFAVMDAQSEDPQIWFTELSPEGQYIQRALRRLHAVIENEAWAKAEFSQ